MFTAKISWIFVQASKKSSINIFRYEPSSECRFWRRFIPKYINATFFDIFQLNSSTYHEHKVTNSFISYFHHAQMDNTPLPIFNMWKQILGNTPLPIFNMWKQILLFYFTYVCAIFIIFPKHVIFILTYKKVHNQHALTMGYIQSMNMLPMWQWRN